MLLKFLGPKYHRKFFYQKLVARKIACMLVVFLRTAFLFRKIAVSLLSLIITYTIKSDHTVMKHLFKYTKDTKTDTVKKKTRGKKSIVSEMNKILC